MRDILMTMVPDPSPHPRYRLLAQIGKGGMGEVFRAHDRLMGQVVALKRVRLPVLATPAAPPIKASGNTDLGEAATLSPGAPLSLRAPVIPGGPETVSGRELPAIRQYPERRTHTPQLAATLAAPSSLGVTAAAPAGGVLGGPALDPEFQSLRLHLTQEFRTLAGLRHPHIVSVLDYGFDRSQQPYFTMELLAGSKTLDEAARNVPFSVQVAFLLQILQALAYLHRRGVLHRDLKPGNILVVPGPRGPQVKLLDFGLALSILGQRTQRAEVSGTIGYIAPEVLLGAPASEASDLFAVGVIAHEILVGKHPLGALPTAELVSGFLGQTLLFSEDARLSPALSAVLRRALCREPGERYADAVAFGHELARATGLPPPRETLDIQESFLQASNFQSRDTEMDVLLGALGQAMDGRGQVLLIGGESGVGKSRLLDEFRVQALVRSARVLRGQAVREGGGAFLILRDVLAPLCLEQPLDNLQSGVLLPLIPRLPEILDSTVVPAPDIDAKSAQDRALAVIEGVLLGTATTDLHPLVVLLEDLQWAGSEVLLLLERLSEVSNSHPLLILGTYRDDERPELPATLPTAAVLKLKRFSKESVARMALAMLGSPGRHSELVDRLYQETEGNAFFMVEVLRALAKDAGQLALVGSRELPAQIFAGGVRAILENRLGRVPAWARSQLARAAVAGRQLDLRALGVNHAPASHSETAIDAWLAACADLSVLEVSDQAWRFSHDKLRECLLEQLEKRGELPQIHREVARAIEQAYVGAERDPHSASLALHFSMAGDAAQAARYGLRAGERSLHGGALEEAVEQLQVTLRHQSQCSKELLDGVRARRLLGMALVGLGRMEECARIVLELHAYVGHPVPSQLGARAGVLLRALGSHVAQRSLSWLRFTPELSRPVIRDLELNFIRNSAALVFTGRPTDMLITAIQQYVLTKQAGSRDSDLIYEAVATFVLSLLPLGPLHRRGPKRVPEDPSALAEAISFNLLIVCAVNVGRGYWGQGLEASALGSATAKAAGDLQLQSMFEIPRLFANLVSGHHETARSQANQLVAEAIRYKNTMFANQGIRCLAALDLIDSQPRMALERLHPMYASAVRTGDALGVLDGMGLLSRASLMAHEPANARKWAEQTLSLTRSAPLSGFAAFEGYLAPAEVLSGLAMEERDPAERRTLIGLASQALLLAWYYAMTFPIGRPRAALATGMYAHMRGQIPLARIFFQQALSAARELAMPHEAERAQTALASLIGQVS